MNKSEAIKLLERALSNCHAGIKDVPKAEHYHTAVACDIRGVLNYLYLAKKPSKRKSGGAKP